MKRLPAALAALLLLLAMLSVSALAESATGVTVCRLSPGFNASPSFTTTDAAFTTWLTALMQVNDPCEPPETRNAAYRYQVTLHHPGGDVTYAIYHDDLYNFACITQPDGSIHRCSVNLPMMLGQGVGETVRFSIPNAHRMLFAQHGWTIAFRHPHMLLQLPARLEASRTDAASLYFTWADLFLRDAGYDITPWLGKAVVPYVYTVYEPVMRSRFFPADSSEVPTSMYAVVLECDGKMIGAYLAARAWDGGWLMSLEGRTASDILPGASRRAYLLGRLPQTQEEQELAALSPEEVIRRYAETGDPRLLDIDMLLQRLGTASSTLYDSLALLPGQSAGKVLNVTRLEKHEGFYEAELEETTWYPQLHRESAATGWKILHFYNSGL